MVICFLRLGHRLYMSFRAGIASLPLIPAASSYVDEVSNPELAALVSLLACLYCALKKSLRESKKYSLL